MEDIPFGKFGFIKKQSIDWIKQHLSITTATVLGTTGLFVLLGQIIKVDNQTDYLTAEVAYQNWNGKKDSTLNKLQKLMHQHPELHTKYDGVIAQKLLGLNEHTLAESYAKAAWKRTSEFSPYYTDFSQCSLLIAESKYEKALEKAKHLKSRLESDEEFFKKTSQVARHGYILYAFNLLRIAVLEGLAGTSVGELTAWRELKEHAGWLGPEYTSRMTDVEAYTMLQENFQDHDCSLLDYINDREIALTCALNEDQSQDH